MGTTPPVRPHRGVVCDPDLREWPRYNYLEEQLDVDVLVHGIRLAQKIATAKGLNSWTLESMLSSNPALNARQAPSPSTS